eukprot:c526_g1_i1.p1 GENE.c526_g1_i1~~c526_g1_i1.p1  ORF type:complete len:166 (-),score=32.89 c526_g1_i1:584-1081(-)
MGKSHTNTNENNMTKSALFVLAFLCFIVAGILAEPNTDGVRRRIYEEHQKRVMELRQNSSPETLHENLMALKKETFEKLDEANIDKEENTDNNPPLETITAENAIPLLLQFKQDVQEHPDNVDFRARMTHFLVSMRGDELKQNTELIDRMRIIIKEIAVLHRRST